MSYRDRNRKRIDLPSGAKCTIRKFSGFDFVGSDSIPSVIMDDEDSEEPPESPTKSEKARTRAKIVFMRRSALLHCCGVIEDGDNRFTIVDKPHHKCADNEISVEQVEKADQDAIVNAVIDFSGMGKAAPAAATPFPETKVASGNDSSSGEMLRVPANGVATLAAV